MSRRRCDRCGWKLGGKKGHGFVEGGAVVCAGVHLTFPKMMPKGGCVPRRPDAGRR
jgi:hypothetical protein